MSKLFWTNINFVAFFFCAIVFAQSAPANSSQITNSIKVPDGQRLLFKTSARGTQIYTCQATKNNQFEWTLKGPQAVLLDEKGKQFGQHYLGPSWEAYDGSKIEGQLKAKTDAPQTDAIPWLLLEVGSHQGEGVFSPVNWIVRLNTVGGKAPTDGCDRDRRDREVSVDYEADYYFYGALTTQ
jgi:hypothetical protein